MSSLPAPHVNEPSERLLRVHVTLKGRAIRSYVFTKEQVVIGRTPEADLFLDNPGVSREHLRLERARNGDYVLQDVGSANGTLLNDQPVTSTRLQDGDVIQIGKFSLHMSYGVDQRNGEASNRAPLPTVDDGTMVLSTVELDAVIKKAHEAEDQALKGPWPNAGTPGANGYGNPYVRRNHAATIGALLLGIVLGAGATFWIMHFLKR